MCFLKLPLFLVKKSKEIFDDVTHPEHTQVFEKVQKYVRGKFTTLRSKAESLGNIETGSHSSPYCYLVLSKYDHLLNRVRDYEQQRGVNISQRLGHLCLRGP